MQPNTRDTVVDALLALAAERRWDDVGLDAVAERAGLTLAQLRAAFPSRLAILAAFTRRLDEEVLGALDPGMAGEAPRERLFDILFSRFEALGPHKSAIRSLARAARRDPPLALALNGLIAGSMAWMLAAARIPATGGSGAMRAQGLAIVWTRTMRVWLDDDDAGLARTMAALDGELRSAERAMARLHRVGRTLDRVRRSLRAFREGGGRSERPEASDGMAERRDPDLPEGHPS